MRTMRWQWLLASVMATSVMLAQADEAERKALAEDLLQVMNVQQTMERSFAMVREMVPAQMAQMQGGSGSTNAASVAGRTDEILKAVAQEFSWEKVKPDYVALYASTFTEDEMRGIIAFYKSPAGQAFVRKQPELMKKSVELSQRLMAKLGPRLQALMNDGAPEATPAK